MNRQLRADGGIMQVAPREKFGLGSSIKKFVRKIIPNEVADIAVKAAPFVAPFNPAVAAAMSGLGTFDQTGSIGDSLKAGGMNYAGGQAARYLGGADFQGNPFSAEGGAFRGGLEGLKGGFSSPLGNQTGFKLGKPIEAVQGVGVNSEGSYLPFQGEEMNIPSYSEQLDIIQKGSPNQMTITESIQKILSPNTTINEKGGEALNLLKKGTKAAFTKSDGKGGTMIDKAAIIGAVTFATSYAEAKALANDAGVDLTEEEYNEALKDEKKEEYAGYLTNFFGGKKDGGRIGFKSGYSPGIVSAALEEYNSVYGTDSSGEEILVKDLYSGGFDEFLEIYTGDAYEKRANGGRIGFESGANEMIKTQLLEEIMPNTDTTTEDYIVIMTEDGPKVVLRSQAPSESMMMDTTTSVFGDAGRGRRIPEELRADGGRIGFKKGSDPVYEMYLEDLEAGIIPSDKSYNEYLDDIEDDPDYDYSYAKGGRVSRKFGSPKEGESEVGIMTIDVEAGDDEDEENMMMAGGITFSSAEKSFLFRKLGGAGGADRSFTMPQLYGILKNPNSPSNIDDAKVLKEIAIMGLGKGQKDGGRIGLKDGTDAIRDIDFLLEGQDEFSMQEFGKKVSELNSAERKELADKIYSYELKFKNGGRIGLKGGSGSSNRVAQLILERDYLLSKDEDVSYIDAELESLGYKMKSEGGVMDVKMPTGKMRKNNAGVVERDYRDEGGFVPVGIKERADDVPAMLSKNEFVMTADAVRGIGNGSVEEGSKKLYNTMKQAEKVGKA